MAERAQKALEFLKKHAEEEIVVATQGNFLRILIMTAILEDLYTSEISQKVRHTLEMTNTGVNELILENGRWCLLRWNDTSHLEE